MSPLPWGAHPSGSTGLDLTPYGHRCQSCSQVPVPWAGALPVLNLPWEPTRTHGSSGGGTGVLGDSGCCPLHCGAMGPQGGPCTHTGADSEAASAPTGAAEPQVCRRAQRSYRYSAREQELETPVSPGGAGPSAGSSGCFGFHLSALTFRAFRSGQTNTSRVHGESTRRSIQEIIHPSPLSGTG